MKTKIVTFCLALFIGTQAAMLVSNVFAQFMIPAEIHVVDAYDRGELFAKPLDGIRIVYSDVTSRESDFGPTMKFIIVNGSSEAIKCIGYSGVCASPEILIAGKDEKGWVCMNGSSWYSIMPGETAELMVGPHDFAKLPARSTEVVVGYEFERPNGEPIQHLAEPMLLPFEFRKEVKKVLDGLHFE